MVGSYKRQGYTWHDHGDREVNFKWLCLPKRALRALRHCNDLCNRLEIRLDSSDYDKTTLCFRLELDIVLFFLPQFTLYVL